HDCRRVRVVRQVESGSEAVALSGRSVIREVDLRWIADRAVVSNLSLVVAAGILPIGDVQYVTAVSTNVVRHAHPGNDSIVVHADDVAGRDGFDMLVAEPKVRGPMAVHGPMILQVQRVIVG